MGYITQKRKIGVQLSTNCTSFFTPGNGTRLGKQMGNAQLNDIIIQGKIRTREDLIKTLGWQQVSEWEYIQPKHLVSTIPQPLRDERTLNPIEKLCNIKTPANHGISQMYDILTELG